jgi:hypothetical protein
MGKLILEEWVSHRAQKYSRKITEKEEVNGRSR